MLDGESVIANSRQRRAIESIEKGLCRFEVGLVEPFGKPVEDRLEDRHRILESARALHYRAISEPLTE
jgi:hypothetical protein